MKYNYRTEQEEFWAGDFGNEYIARNKRENLLASNTALFTKILSRTTDVKSIIEFGANIGLNLQSIRYILPMAELSAIEINKRAAYELDKLGDVKVYFKSILDFICDYERDLVLSKGVLIHMNPEVLPVVYNSLYQASNKYICIAEYYSPHPVEVEYRGHKMKLFKRDFAGELLDKFSDLRLIDYGFAYHRDANFPLDDITWFLMEKVK